MVFKNNLINIRWSKVYVDQINQMICMMTDLTGEACKVNDQWKAAAYYRSQSVCIWTFKSWINRNQLMEEVDWKAQEKRGNQCVLKYMRRIHRMGEVEIRHSFFTIHKRREYSILVYYYRVNSTGKFKNKKEPI